MTDRHQPIPFGRLAAEVGIKIHISGLHRWRNPGVKGRDGRRVRLRATRIGGRTYTTIADYEAFINQLNAEPGEGGASPVHASERRRREVDAAEAMLVNMGV